MNRINEEEYIHLDYDEMINALCSCQSAISYTEANMNISDITIRNDSMSTDVLVEYLEDFEYAIKFNGPNFVFSDKVLAKLFCKGIKPSSLRYDILNRSPESVEEAIDYLFGMVDSHRMVQVIQNNSQRHNRSKHNDTFTRIT